MENTMETLKTRYNATKDTYQVLSIPPLWSETIKLAAFNAGQVDKRQLRTYLCLWFAFEVANKMSDTLISTRKQVKGI